MSKSGIEEETFFSLFMMYFWQLVDSDNEKHITKFYFIQHHFFILQYYQGKFSHTTNTLSRNTERNFSQQKINKIYKCTFAFHSFKIKFLLEMHKVLNLVASSASTNSDYHRVHVHLYNKLNNWCSTQHKYITPLPSIPNVTMITNEAKKNPLIVVPRQFLVNT